MRRFVPIIILVFLLAIAAGVIYGFVRTKQKREVEMTEFYLCETNFKEGQYQKAVQLLEAFIEAHPKSEKAADARYYLASSREKMGDRVRAMAAWSKLLESYPTSPNRAEAYYYLGVGYQDLNQYAKALENYSTVVNRFANMPVAAGAWYSMGRIYEIQGQEAAAVNAYKSVVGKHPGTEFAADAERRQGAISLKRFLRENTTPYQVKRGDSLVKIAAKFQVTPELLKRINGLSANMLQINQVLRVIDANFNILVDMSKYRLHLRSGDTTIKTYIISIGKDETPTPPGDYRVTDKLLNPVWYSTQPSGAKEAIQPDDPRNELGTRWIGFKPAYGIHGTIAPESIGKAVSNGCVRMLNEDVEELYDLVGTGTPVKIVAGVKESREPVSESRTRKTGVNKLDEHRKLPDTITSKLDKSYPGWRFPDISGDVAKYMITEKPTYDPNLIWGDFNADGTKDYAVQITHGDPRKDRAVVVFLSRGSDFDMYVLESGLRDTAFSPDEVCLQLYKKGQQDYDYDADKHFSYASDSVGVRYSRVAGVSYVLEEGKFQRVATVD